MPTPAKAGDGSHIEPFLSNTTIGKHFDRSALENEEAEIKVYQSLFPHKKEILLRPGAEIVNDQTRKLRST